MSKCNKVILYLAISKVKCNRWCELFYLALYYVMAIAANKDKIVNFMDIVRPQTKKTNQYTF